MAPGLVLTVMAVDELELVMYIITGAMHSPNGIMNITVLDWFKGNQGITSET